MFTMAELIWKCLWSVYGLSIIVIILKSDFASGLYELLQMDTK